MNTMYPAADVPKFALRLAVALLGMGVLAGPARLCAQQATPEGAQATPVASRPATGKAGVAPLPEAPIPNAGDSLFAPLAIGAGPETLGQKTESYVVITFGPRAFIAPLFGVARFAVFPNRAYPPDWKYGPGAIGRQYGSNLGSRVALETARYGVGALMHEDFRYRPSKEKGFARLVHAVGYTLVDQNDDGERRLAYANFAGAAAGGFVPNLWLPDGFNRPRDGLRKFGTRMGGFAFANVAREFSPEIFGATHKIHIPFPHLPIPEWWTRDLSANHP